MKTMKIGIIGCGNISAAYFKNLKQYAMLEVAACADLVPERARARAGEYAIPRPCGVAELLADPEIELVVNLTLPKAHAEIAEAALQAGKHVYGEKPLAIRREDGKRILQLAKARKLRLGSAPDTFLGAGLQTCRKLIADGAIGRPVGATAFMLCRGHESWHPEPAFYYQTGGGPMFDMGPYYLTALVALMGPVRRVSGMTQKTFPERVISSRPKAGEKIAVEVATHVAGLLDFEQGAIATLVTSFDVWATETPRLEIYGSDGTLSVPDPNSFDGPARLRRQGAQEWENVPLVNGYSAENRGLGVADMVCAIRSRRDHRANGEMAFHVLDIMQAFEDSSAKRRHITLTSQCRQPAPLPPGLKPGEMDA